MKPASKVGLGALATLLIVGGGYSIMADNSTGPREDNPEFAAWFVNPPETVYEGLGITFTVAVQNVQEKKLVRTPDGGIEYIGEAGTHPVCLRLNLQDADCQTVSLIPGEIKEIRFRFETLPVGTHTLTARNATITLTVEPSRLPLVGEWANGTHGNIRLIGFEEVPKCIDPYGGRKPHISKCERGSGDARWNNDTRIDFELDLESLAEGFRFYVPHQHGRIYLPTNSTHVSVTFQWWPFWLHSDCRPNYRGEALCIAVENDGMSHVPQGYVWMHGAES